MTVLAVDNLFRSFGGIHAVDGVTFDIEQAEIVGIIGPNGSGKSTLFNLLTGALKPDAGTIMLFGREHHPARSLQDRPGRPRAHLPDPGAVREHDCAGEPLDRRGAVRLEQRHGRRERRAGAAGAHPRRRRPREQLVRRAAAAAGDGPGADAEPEGRAAGRGRRRCTPATAADHAGRHPQPCATRARRSW